MQGEMIKTYSAGTRGKCTGEATLTCATAVTLGKPGQCTDGGTLAACANATNLQTPGKTKRKAATNVGHCCGQGTLVASEGGLVGSPQCAEGTNLSVCDQAGQTLQYK